jgi:hypothetical protein
MIAAPGRIFTQCPSKHSAVGAAAQVRMRARSVAACLKDQIPADIPCHYSGVQGSTINC